MTHLTKTGLKSIKMFKISMYRERLLDLARWSIESNTARAFDFDTVIRNLSENRRDAGKVLQEPKTILNHVTKFLSDDEMLLFLHKF